MPSCQVTGLIRRNPESAIAGLPKCNLFNFSPTSSGLEGFRIYRMSEKSLNLPPHVLSLVSNSSLPLTAHGLVLIILSLAKWCNV